MKAIDFVIIAAVALAVFFAVRRVLKNRKNGCSCGCGAGGCEGCDKKRKNPHNELAQ